MKREKFLFMVSGPNVPSTRFRMLPYSKELRQRGYRCDVAYSIPEKYGSYRFLGWRLSQKLKWAVRKYQSWRAGFRGYSAIVIERELFDSPNGEIEQQLAQLPSRLVLDVDDGVFLRYPEKFTQLFGAVDHVIAGSDVIANSVREQCSSVGVIPTVIELDEYPAERIASTKPTAVIGWIGTDSNIAYLNLIVPALNRLLEKQPFRFQVITGNASSMEKIESAQFPIDFVPWSPETAVRDLSRFDIGVMPLPDEAWEQYKCGCKLIQYMAGFVPSVASPVGVNREITQHGENGYLAESLEDWYACLSQLLENAELRQRFSEAGRSTVEQSYTVQSQVDRFLHALLPTEPRQSDQTP